jgi:hypothetical protein
LGDFLGTFGHLTNGSYDLTHAQIALVCVGFVCLVNDLHDVLLCLSLRVRWGEGAQSSELRGQCLLELSEHHPWLDIRDELG